MTLIKLLSIAYLSVILVGCASQKTLVPVSGSRADGTVVFAYEFGLFERPVVDYNSAKASAKQRCSAWGYTDAEPFGGQQSRCLAFNGYGNCVRNQVLVTYQCTGTRRPQ
jgi:hypothetical protein